MKIHLISNLVDNVVQINVAHGKVLIGMFELNDCGGKQTQSNLSDEILSFAWDFHSEEAVNLWLVPLNLQQLD